MEYENTVYFKQTASDRIDAIRLNRMHVRRQNHGKRNIL
jgi:hypothetical protein